MGAMDSPTERMPIACVHCAKAKAKCDKKVSFIIEGSRWKHEALVCLLERTVSQMENGLWCAEALGFTWSFDALGYADADMWNPRCHAQDV